jgi:hypothetical protein
MTGFVVDCVTAPSSSALRGAGVTGLCRYLSWLDRDTLGKIIHQAEYDRLIGDGFAVALNWEYAATDWTRGSAAGLAHGAEAVRQAKALGYPPGCVILGSADFDMTLAAWGNAGAAYGSAFSRTVRAAGYLAGVYGPYDVLTWCRDAGYADVFWQAGMSTDWSGHRNANAWPWAHLRQRRYITIGGITCDYNDILRSNYGACLAGRPMGATMLKDETIAGSATPGMGDRNAAVLLLDVWKAITLGQLSGGALWSSSPLSQILTDAQQLRDALKTVALDAKAAASLPTTVTMTDADKAEILAQLVEGVAGVFAELAPLVPTPQQYAAAVVDELHRRTATG